MKYFWTFYQGIDNLENPFICFETAHFVYLALVVLMVFVIMKNYYKGDYEKKLVWQKRIALFFLIEESFYYIWLMVQPREHLILDVLSLELCSFVSLANLSILFHNNKQIRLFSAILGFMSGPVALIYPATLSTLYPVVSYRAINFFVAHGMYIVFALMMLSDETLLEKKRLIKHVLICVSLLTFVYFFDLVFGTQYMFVGTPPEIPIIRMVYDIVGQVAFLPIAVLLFGSIQVIIYACICFIRNKYIQN